LRADHPGVDEDADIDAISIARRSARGVEVGVADLVRGGVLDRERRDGESVDPAADSL
jgi:hypothetical protein